MAYATGKNAKFISDRSGFSFPYSERVREWNGAIVHTSEFEAKHPQLEPPRVTSDAQALKDARPQNPDLNTPFLVKTTNDIFSGAKAELPSKIELTDALVSGVGSVTVTT